jgi:hypothetical protein
MTQEITPFPLAGDKLFWLLGGAALGAVVMALATPKSGRELRRDLRMSLRTAAMRLTGGEDPLELGEDERIETLFI